MKTMPLRSNMPVRSVITADLKALYDEKLHGRKDSPIKAELRSIRISDIKIDLSYKKTPNPDAVTDLAANWNDNLYRPILVAERGKNLFIIRGLKCTLAALLRGKRVIDAMVIKSNGQSHETTLFTNLCSDSKTIRAPHKHKTALQDNAHPKHAEAAELQRICDAANVKIAEYQAAGVLTGTERISLAISQYGPAIVEHALKLYREIWPKDRVHAYLTSGLAAWLFAYSDVKYLTDAKIISALKIAFEEHKMAILEEKSRNTNRRHTDPSFAELFTIKYNQQAHGRGKLSISKIKQMLE